MKKIIKGILITIGVLFILFCVFVGYVIIDINKQEELLSNEVNELLTLDLIKDDVNTVIVTRDEYAVIEKTMKNYLKDYSDNCKEFIRSIDEFDFENMFTANTFLNDGPDFVESKGRLSQLKDTLNKNLDNLMEMSSEEYIMGLINNKDLDDYSVDLYRQYMFGDSVNSFNDTISSDVQEMKEIGKDVNLFLDDCYAMYDFMSKNRSYWYVDGNIVYFSTDRLVNEYNALLNKIIMDSNNLTDYDGENSQKDTNGNAGSV